MLFDLANDDVVGSITNDLVLELLPSLETLLDENLGTETETLGGEIPKLVLVLCEAGAESTEGEGGAEDDGVADASGGGEGVLDGRDGDRVGSGNANLWTRSLG